MSNDEDWLMNPVLEGLCRYESLKDGTLDLVDIADMNEALMVRNENRNRAESASKPNG